jgi:tetratricopeptide (TPR) repeat protein
LIQEFHMSAEETRRDSEIRQLCQRGRFSEALSLSHQFVDLLTSAYGPQHWKVAAALQNISGICRQIDDYDQAFAACNRAIAIVEQLGDRPKDLASLLSNLALLNLDLDRSQEAERHCRRAIQVLEAAGDADSEPLGAYIDNLALILARQGRFTDAIPYCQRALTIFETRLGRSHPKVAATVRNLGDLRKHAGL